MRGVGRSHRHNAFAMCFVLLVWLTAVSPVFAQARAWLDRDVVTLGDTVTLTIETDVSNFGALPDPYTLTRDFRVVGQHTSQRTQIVNGEIKLFISMSLTLRPVREGILNIPMMEFGGQGQAPLRVEVLPAPAQPSQPGRAPMPTTDDSRRVAVPDRADAPAFIETLLDTTDPYVQQTVGYVVRIYYLPGALLNGELDQDVPDGVALQKAGDEVEFRQDIGGREYKVVERRYLLVPERAGRVVLPPAKFRGSGIQDVLGGVFGDSGGGVELQGKGHTLEVQPLPANAPQPWLPVQSLRLRYLEAPQQLRVGEAATVVVELAADGASVAQLPKIELQVDGQAQVLAEAPESDERFLDTQPQALQARRFTIIPARDGPLRVVGPRFSWWDARTGTLRTTSLPDLQLEVGGGGKTPTPQAQEDNAQESATPSNQSETAWWQRWSSDRLWVWLLLALAWCVPLIWLWRYWRRKRAAWALTTLPPENNRALQPRVTLPPDVGALMRSLQSGDLAATERVLCAMAAPPAADLEALKRRLGDPAQRAAVDALQGARWGDGNAAEARAKVREAFANGPRWIEAEHAPSRGDALILPPLYPE